MEYIHIEDVTTGEIECSRVYPVPRISSVAELDDWYDQILIEDKTLENAKFAVTPRIGVQNWGKNKYTTTW